MIINKQKDLKNKDQKGAVLLIAVTVASLVLSIGLGILNITTKEVILSAYNRESNKAFYASNAGIECALFWDISYAKSEPAWTESPFATSTNPVLTKSEIANSLFCNGQILNPHSNFGAIGIEKGVITATTTFKFSTWSTAYGEPFSIDNPCVEVTLLKSKETVTGFPQPIIRTRISAIGYNTCNETKKRRVSRGIKVMY